MNDNNGKLGLFACIAIIVGGCIGSAIYSLSGMTMYTAGPACILSWALAGIILMLYGMQVTELSSRFPASGGIFVFPQKALGKKNQKTGELWGFVSAWAYIVSNTIAVAFSAIYVATYMGAGFEKLANLQIPLAIAAVVICTALNLLKITDAGKFNNIIVAALAITLVLFACMAIFGGTFDPGKFTPFFTQGVGGGSGFIKAIPTASLAYGACVSIAFMVSEIKDPNKNVPKSLIIGLLIIIVLYLLVIVGTLGNLDIAILKDDKNSFFRYVPIFAAIWTSALGKYMWLSKLISISALLALITTMLVLLAITARTFQATAQNGYLPKVFAKESKNGVPASATLLIGAVALVLSCFPEWTEMIVNLGAIFSIISIIITCISLIVARKNDGSKVKDGFTAPLGNILPIITIIVLTLCYVPDIINGSWKMLLFTIIVYAIGMIIYSIGSKKKYGK